MKMINFLKEVEKTTNKYLSEAGLDYSRNKKGETPFTKTDGSEFHIQKIIEDFAIAKGVTKAEAQKLFDGAVDNMTKRLEKSQKLNGTMIGNVAESVAFDMLDAIPMEDVKFNKRIFQELFQEVKSEVPEFYPLSNVFEPKRIEPTIWFAPDKLAPEFNSVRTAACSPDAKLIFNVPFMEKLMKFASIKGIKADPTKLHGKKYVSQGGNIPDEYLYAEFVLLHEIMHYGNGDFFFEKAYKLKGKLVNYVGDFVTNYNLVKSGYAQLPMGLFNDEINYDRYNSYQQMYDVVKEEMDKLKPEDQKDMQDQMDDMGDDMPDEGEGADPGDSNDQNKPTDEEIEQAAEEMRQKNECFRKCVEEGRFSEKMCGELCFGDMKGGDGEGGKSIDDPRIPKPEWQPDDVEGGKPGEGPSGEGEDNDEDSDDDGKGGGDGDKSPEETTDKDGGTTSDGEGDDKPDDKGKGGKSGEEDKAEQKKKEEDAKADMAAQEERAKKQKQDEKEGKTAGKIPSSVDDAIKDNANKMSNAQKDTGKQTKTGMNPDAIKPGDISSMMSGENTGSGKNSADSNPYALGEKQYKPKMNWKAMLKKMVPSGVVKNETYSRPSRRTTSSMVSVAQTGRGVVKPGTKEVDSDKKGLCFVLDNSGSTMGKIGAIQNDIMNLMKKQSKNLNNELYVMKFSNDVHYFKVDVKKKKYGRITDVADFVKTGRSSVKCDKPVKELFKSTYGGMTELTAKITLATRTLFQKNFNVVLFSDSDISGGNNATQLKQIFKDGKKQLAIIGCDKSDYKSFVDLLGNKNNITYYS